MPQRSDEAQIHSLIETWAEAVRAKNLRGAVAHHSDDVVMFDVPMPVQVRGIKAYQSTWELFFANSPGGPGSFDVTELQIAVGDRVAYVHAILNIFDSKARLTMGLRKESGQWLIAHEHHSYPIELASEE